MSSDFVGSKSSLVTPLTSSLLYDSATSTSKTATHNSSADTVKVVTQSQPRMPIRSQKRDDMDRVSPLKLSPDRDDNRIQLKSFIGDWINLATPAFSFFASQLAWAVQIGFVTPELENLGLSDNIVNYAWLAGPISGIIVQPIVGVYSDRLLPYPQSRMGRRIPFIIGGTALVVFSLLLFSNARYIGYLLGDSPHDDFHVYGVIIGVVAFYLLDFSINVSQSPQRALLTDIIPARFHKEANAIFGIANGIGSVIGYALGTFLSYNSAFGGGLSALFGCAAVLVVIANAITIYRGFGERPLNIRSLSLRRPTYDAIEPESTRITNPLNTHPIGDSDDDDDADNDDLNMLINGNESACYKLKAAFLGLSTMPKPLERAFIVQFATYFGHFTTFIYLTAWFGKEITDGDPNGTDDDEDDYNRGVKLATIGLTIMSFSSIFISIVMSHIIKKHLRLVWFTSLVLYAGILWTLTFIKIQWMAIVLISCIGLPLAASMVIPWTVCTETLQNSNDKGLYTTTFNLAQCFPEILVSVSAGAVISAFDGNVSAVLAMGGCGCAVGAFCVLFVIDPVEWRHQQYAKFSSVSEE